MDMSETYVGMCAKAEEIQIYHIFNYSDFILLNKHFLDKKTLGIVQRNEDNYLRILTKNSTMGMVGDEKTRDYPKGSKKVTFIWIPRQDQLQEMLGDYSYILAYIARFNHEFAPRMFRGVNSPFDTCTSMEQLWLAFVMEEKYDKSWDGMDWVKQVNIRRT